MTGYLWTALVILAGLVTTALSDMASQEVRDRLDHLPHAILHLGARRLDPSQRITVYQDEWLPELIYILKGEEARPITRFVTGTWYALGILARAARIAPHLHRPLPSAARAADHQIARIKLRNRLLLDLDTRIQETEASLQFPTEHYLSRPAYTFSGPDRVLREELPMRLPTIRNDLMKLRTKREALAKVDAAKLASDHGIASL